MMASSQVEFAASSPFGCALRRDHNRRNRCTAAAAAAPFNDLVSPCISDEHSHSRHHVDFTDLWVHQPQWQSSTSSVNSSPDNNVTVRKNGDANSNKNSKNDRGKIKGKGEDKWAKAREMVFTGDNSSPPDNNNVTIRNNRNDSDNNKNKDDRGEIKGNDEDKWAKAREMVFAGGDRKSNNSLPLAEIPNLRGVSSIVQKWRCFEAESKCLQSNSSTRSNSSTTFTENVTCIDVPSRVSDVCDERTVNQDDHFGDWEPDRMAVSGPPSAMGRDSDATAENERLRLRVQDIIRKLTSAKKENNRISNSNGSSNNNNNKKNNNDNSNNSNDLGRTSVDHSEQGCFSSVSNSPRIRGRGAFNNLLVQMEAERQKELEGLVERKAVSKFSHRGRIQALLKVRFLRRGLEAKEVPPVNNTPFEFKKFTQSAITRIRERFKGGIQNSSIEVKNSHREVIDNAASEQSIVNEPVTSSEQQETDGAVISHNVITHDILDEETFSTSKQNEIDEKIQPRGFTESTEAALSFTDANKIKHEKEEDVTSNQQLSGTNDDSVEDCAHQDTHCENNLLMGMDSHWVSDVCHPEDGWELHSDYQEQPDTNLDWINDISRPRSDWEDLRQARYCEMLDPFMENKDIRVLLERRSVSTFLSSDLKDRIDRLMLSRTQQQQMNVMKNPIEERREETVIVEEEDKGEDEHEVDHDEERSYTDYYDEYEDESDHHYNENDDCIDQSGPSAPPLWIHNQSHEVSDDSYEAAFPYIQPSLSSNTCSQDHQHISHHTIEMDLIYDLRGQMEQLYREMSQLRRSIKSCISIQTKLQCSVRQEAASAVRCSDQKETRHSANTGSSKGKCRICCEMPADSLLYRCGHVCTCFKCAHELQWSSGKCPICGSKIQDVVRINAIS